MSDSTATPAMLDIVVTYLEMLKPPTRPTVPVPPVGKIALLRAERPTISYYRYLYNTVGEPWLWWERRRLSNDELARIIHAACPGVIAPGRMTQQRPSGSAGRRAARPYSKAGSSREQDEAAFFRRHCARSSRRNCRPA